MRKERRTDFVSESSKTKQNAEGVSLLTRNMVMVPREFCEAVTRNLVTCTHWRFGLAVLRDVNTVLRLHLQFGCTLFAKVMSTVKVPIAVCKDREKNRKYF